MVADRSTHTKHRTVTNVYADRTEMLARQITLVETEDWYTKTIVDYEYDEAGRLVKESTTTDTTVLAIGLAEDDAGDHTPDLVAEGEIVRPVQTYVGDRTVSVITDQHTVADILRWAVASGWASEFVTLYEMATEPEDNDGGS